MNYKIAKTMLGLSIGYLTAFYILKFIFPEILLQTIAHPTLIRLGDFMTKYPFSIIVFQLLSSAITFYLFSCACCGTFVFTRKQLIYLGAVVVVVNLVYYLLPELYTHTCTVSMLSASALLKGKLNYTVISFAIHGYLSQFLFAIKGFETIVMFLTPISGLLMGVEGYVWLVLLSLIFYFKENKNGTLASSVS